MVTHTAADRIGIQRNIDYYRSNGNRQRFIFFNTDYVLCYYLVPNSYSTKKKQLCGQQISFRLAVTLEIIKKKTKKC